MAALVAPILPELYAGRSQADVFAFHRDVAEASELPLILFNYPSLTGVDLTPEVVSQLAEIETVRYIKESTSDSTRVHAIRRLLGDRVEVICGAPNVALESLALGCRSWITGIHNVVPRSAKRLATLMSRGDLENGQRVYEQQVLPLVDFMVATANPSGTIKAGIRSRAALDVGVPRRPGMGLAPAERRALETLCRQIDGVEQTEGEGSS
jgi:4-hydroxy-tetrahydrodipicolinate synthase